MAKINAQYDNWGGRPGQHYIEFEVNGRTLQIIVSDDHVNVIGPIFTDRCSRSVNSFYAMLPGGRFETVQQYHEYVESGRLPVNGSGGFPPTVTGGENAKA